MLVYGVWLALAGAVAVLAGLAGTRHRHRLRASGLTAWAMVLPTPSEQAQAGAASADPSDVIVHGSDGRWSDRSFLVTGAVALAVGVVLAGLIG